MKTEVFFKPCHFGGRSKEGLRMRPGVARICRRGAQPLNPEQNKLQVKFTKQLVFAFGEARTEVDVEYHT